MRRRAVRWPSPSMAVALTALFVALGGTGYAAFSLPKNSVGTKQLKKGAVTTSKIKNGAVTTSKIKNGAVTSKQINTNGLTVPNALYANTAGSAGSATNASNAGHASSADTATKATSAASPSTLASGQTETGTWALGGTAAASGDLAFSTISFPFAMASAPKVQIIAAGATPPSGCSGSVTSPGASSGNLCIFEGYSEGSPAAVAEFEPIHGTNDAGFVYGATLYLRATAPSTFDRSGSWAATG